MAKAAHSKAAYALSVGMCMLQIEQLNKQVQELHAKSFQASNCQSELEMLKVS